ncbi:MAG: hypothetical protein RR595_15420, partial [Lysinibacillus sp.]
MDVYYEKSKWKKMDEAIDYIVGKPGIAKLYNKAEKIIMDADGDIKSKDTDGVITFKAEEFADKAKNLQKKYETMQEFANEVG